MRYTTYVQISSPETSTSLVENNRLHTIQEHPLLAPPLNCSRKNLAFDITAFFDQFLWTQGMIHPCNPLLDNWTLIQVRCNEMCGRANDLDTTLICLMVR